MVDRALASGSGLRPPPVGFRRVAATTLRRVFSPNRLLAMLLAPLAVFLGYAVATGRVRYALVLLIASPASWLVSRRRGGLLAGVALILVVPSWLAVGSAQLAVLRVAPLFAATALLTARDFRPNRIDAAVAILLLAAVGSVVIQGMPGTGKVLLNEMIALGFYVGARVVPAAAARKVMTAAHLAGALGALTVIYEWHAGHSIFVDANAYYWNATESTIFRPGGIFGSPPGAATVLAITALLGLPALRSAASARERGVLAVSSLVTVIACVLTLTRASLIGLAVGLAVYLWLSRSSLITPTRMVIGVLVASLVVVVGLPLIQSTGTFQQAVARPGNLGTRESIWQLALPIVFDSPSHLAFGVGAENTVVPGQGGPASAALGSSPSLISEGTHNQYVLALLEQGLVGLGAVVLWLGAMILAGTRTALRVHGDPTVAALTATVVAMAIIFAANNALLHPPSFAVLALAGGLLAGRIDAGNGDTAQPGG